MREIEALVLTVQSQTENVVIRHAAFAELVRRFQDMVYGCALAMLGDHELAQDSAQETFLTAYRQINQVRQPAAFPGWLRRVVLTQCRRVTRGNHQANQGFDSVGQLSSEQTNPSMLVELHELQDDLWHSIQALPETQRVATILVHIDGYSHAEVAMFLDISIDSVKKRLERARNQLRQRMIDEMKETLHQQRPSQNERFMQTLQLTTLLENAALEGQQSTLELLLLDGLDVDMTARNGQTLLHWAAQMGHLEAVELLLQHNANPRHKDKMGKTPRQLAIEGKHSEIVELLPE